MENILENKEKFFTQYFMQDILVNRNGRYFLTLQTLHWVKTYQDTLKLELIPLSKISNTDAIGCLNILFDEATVKEMANLTRELWIKILKTELSAGFGSVQMKVSPYFPTVLNVYDFLRSKGYALPWMGLSVEKLVEYGWVVLA